MDKNTAWAIGLSTVVLFGFMYINTKFNNGAGLKTAQKSPVAQQEEQANIATNTESATENQGAFSQEKPVIISSIQEGVEQTYTIDTDCVHVVFSNKGGDVVSYELKAYTDSITKQNVQMAGKRAFDISLGDYTQKSNDDIYKVYVAPDGKAIKFSCDYVINNKNLTLSKIYTFHDNDYAFKLDILMEGEGIEVGEMPLYTLHTSTQIGPKFDPKNKRYEYRNFVSYVDDKKSMKALNDNKTQHLSKAFSWVGVTGKYFAELVIPEDVSSIQDAVYSTKVEERDLTPNNQVFITRKAPDTATSTLKDSYYVYVGPRQEKELVKYNRKDTNTWDLYDIKLTSALQTSGILSWLEIILKFVMEQVNKLVHNWGVSIIITTLILKFVLFPLTKKSSLATVRMQELQPQIQSIQDKYKDNPAKLNEAMAKFYKEAGYNPASGCLPILIQFPLLLAMYNLFNNYFEFRGSLFIPGWIVDLSQPDSVFVLSFSLPFLGNNIRLLPVIYVISQLLFGKITNNGGATTGQSGTQMKMMMYVMPIMFFFLFYNVSSGLLLYWTASNLFTLVQQLVINRMIKKQKALQKSTIKPFPIKKKKR